MSTLFPRQRPRLTLAILLFAVVDIAGMLLLATGVMWFAHGTPLFLPDFPTNAISAAASAIIGLLLMLWAAARILREVTKQINQQIPEHEQR